MNAKIQMPGTILFACTHNMIRSPIAEGLTKAMFPNKVFVDSCGIYEGVPDGFVITVMEEVGIDMSGHTPKSFSDLEDEYFDLIICFSPESHEVALKLAEGKSTKLITGLSLMRHWAVIVVKNVWRLIAKCAVS